MDEFDSCTELWIDFILKSRKVEEYERNIQTLRCELVHLGKDLNLKIGIISKKMEEHGVSEERVREIMAQFVKNVVEKKPSNEKEGEKEDMDCERVKVIPSELFTQFLLLSVGKKLRKLV